MMLQLVRSLTNISQAQPAGKTVAQFHLATLQSFVSKLVSDAFNNYFANIGKKLENEILSAPISPMVFLNNPTCNSFFIFAATCSEIETGISQLKTVKFVGTYSIPVDILKMLKTYISKPLEIIFNASLSTGIVPSDFKIANIVPVLKKGSVLLVQLPPYLPHFCL